MSEPPPPTAAERVLPWTQLMAESFAFYLFTSLHGTRNRAAVVTLERLAALAAGGRESCRLGVGAAYCPRKGCGGRQLGLGGRFGRREF